MTNQDQTPLPEEKPHRLKGFLRDTFAGTRRVGVTVLAVAGAFALVNDTKKTLYGPQPLIIRHLDSISVAPKVRYDSRFGRFLEDRQVYSTFYEIREDGVLGAEKSREYWRGSHSWKKVGPENQLRKDSTLAYDWNSYHWDLTPFPLELSTFYPK